ncbi:MAG: TonB-dependent receptor, partial [Candidatus Marinimicrobia bacterium]|nr:TonB-dependent receptor [Candidatus Neomarinimicrobiota bacterium]
MRFIILIWIFLFNIVFPQLTGVITGQVVNRDTQQPLAGVNIQVASTDLGAASDLNGYFYIDKIPVGTQHIVVNMIGYKERIFLNLPVTSARPVNVVAELEIDPVQLESINVTGNLFVKSSNASFSTMNVDQSEIRSDPGGAYDIQRVVQSLPSVTSASDQENEIISRGGAPGENLFVMDEIEIQNPNHFALEGTGGGPINMINPLFVRQIEFTPGAFSAHYGDKASSVMDIKLREGSRDQFEWDFDFSMAGAGLNAEGPIRRGRGSYLIGSSWSYLDLVIKSTGLTAVPQYNHHQAKIVYDINHNNRLIANALISFDNINIESENDVVSYGAESVDQKGETYVGGLSLRTLLGEVGYGIATLSFTKQRIFHWVYNGNDHENPWFKRDNVISELHLKDNWLVQSKLGEFNTGFTI